MRDRQYTFPRSLSGQFHLASHLVPLVEDRLDALDVSDPSLVPEYHYFLSPGDRLLVHAARSSREPAAALRVDDLAHAPGSDGSNDAGGCTRKLVLGPAHRLAHHRP